jgi:hypothetical protein
MGMTMLNGYHLPASHYILLQPFLAYVNQPKVMVAFENYHYNICANRMTRKLKGEV